MTPEPTGHVRPPRAATGSHDKPIVTRPERVVEFPVTSTQAALWIAQQLEPLGTALNIPLAFDVEGPLDVPALHRAFATLYARHEILRTVYVERGDRLLQRVLPVGALPLDWEYAERPRIVGGDPRAAMWTLAHATVRRPFDLSRASPLRVRLTAIGSDGRHLLAIVFHHIAVDRATVDRFNEELSQLYAGFRDGRPTVLAPLTRSFAAYARWVGDQATPGALEPGLAAWRRALDGHSGLLDLPGCLGDSQGDLRGDAQNSPLGDPRFDPRAQSGVLPFELPADVANAIRRFASTHELSHATVLLGCFQALLYLHTGQRDVLVGTPFVNRGPGDEFGRVMGCCINTLPVPTMIDETVGFADLLKETQRGLLHTWAFRHVPFDAIVEHVKPPRTPGVNPLCQVGFVVQSVPTPLRLDGVRSTALRIERGSAPFDFLLSVTDDGSDGPMRGVASYDTSRIVAAGARALVDRFTRLVGTLIETPERPLRDLSVATPQELAQFAAWNDTARPWAPAGTVLDLITAQAAATPDAVAVMAMSGVLQYAEVIARAARVSRALVARGIAPGDLVGLSVSRDAGMLVGALGIVGAGAAYVPLDPAYPDERLAFIASASALRGIVIDPGERDHVGRRLALDQRCIVVAIEGDGTLSPPEAAPPGTYGVTAPPVDGLMYVIFTSGSTGRPKGVRVPHESVVNFLRSMAREPGFASTDRLLAVTTLSFDIAVLELFLPLTRGGSVVIASADQVLDGEALASLIEEHQITVMQATPSGWRMLIDEGWEGAPESLRALCGGETLPPALAASLLPRVAELWNLYGPTETTVWSTCARVRTGAPITIGRAIDNTTLHVLSPGGQPLPIGVPGELFIGGAGVTAGYLGRADLTHERFVDAPWGRLYRTGDHVRRLPDGQVTYLGRADDQVKVNGHRVELAEVERALEELPAVGRAAVRVSVTESGSARLVAYVVAAANGAVFGSELRRALRTRLPDYMVPSFVLPIDALPLTPNGKVDRRALPDPLAGGTDRASVEPRTEAERTVAHVWRELLGVEHVGVLDNFFEIGGHSLLAIRATARVHERVGVRLDPRAMFFQTLEQVAQSLEPQPRDARS